MQSLPTLSAAHAATRYLTNLKTALSAALALGLLGGAAQAATFSVGPSAGQTGSACDFATLQAAVDALPQDDTLHRIELEDGVYEGADATLRLVGKRVRIETRFDSGSRCSTANAPGRALLRSSVSTLESGKTVVVLDNAELILERVRITGSNRGAVLVRNALLDLEDGSINGNFTQNGASGAAVVLEGGLLLARNFDFNGNNAGANGGALFCAPGAAGESAAISLTDVSMNDNDALNGGAIYLFGRCQLNLQGESELLRNTADVDGGAIATETRTDVGLRNDVLIHGRVRFTDNEAVRNGGAIAINAGNQLQVTSVALAQFTSNRAGNDGGAIDLRGQGPQIVLRDAIFRTNRAAGSGGAIASRDRIVSISAQCNSSTFDEDRYCAGFDGNRVGGITPDSAGGTLFVGSGDVLVQRYAFVNSLGRDTGAVTQGVVARVNAGTLRLVSTLVTETLDISPPEGSLIELLSGAHALLSFNSIVDNPGTALRVNSGASADLVGNIVADNTAGISGAGTIAGTCNNAQLGSDSVPVDPRFETNDRGRFRLAADSPMRNAAQGCDDDRLPDGYQFPRLDLDGFGRVLGSAGEDDRDLDLGAFEFQAGPDRIFDSGFEEGLL